MLSFLKRKGFWTNQWKWVLKEGLERNLEFSMKLRKKLDENKGDQVATISEFNRGKKKKRKDKEIIWADQHPLSVVRGVAHKVQLSKTCWWYKASGSTKTTVQCQKNKFTKLGRWEELLRERERDALPLYHVDFQHNSIEFTRIK